MSKLVNYDSIEQLEAKRQAVLEDIKWLAIEEQRQAFIEIIDDYKAEILRLNTKYNKLLSKYRKEVNKNG